MAFPPTQGSVARPHGPRDPRQRSRTVPGLHLDPLPVPQPRPGDHAGRGVPMAHRGRDRARGVRGGTEAEAGDATWEAVRPRTRGGLAGGSAAPPAAPRVTP